jgi:general secretion pathway protein I
MDTPAACSEAGAARAAGFTLLEVLVALTIIAVALTAAMRGAISVTGNSRDVDLRVYATLAAQNQLLEMRLQQSVSAPSDASYDCEQGGVVFRCSQHVLATPNPFFRWVEIHVADGGSGRELASMITLLRVGS